MLSAPRVSVIGRVKGKADGLRFAMCDVIEFMKVT